MRAYMELCLQGEGSIPEREVMLKAQRKVIEAKMATLQNMMDFIDTKMDFYAKVRAGEITYVSSLMPPEKPAQ